jgi:hypothetical protein
MVISHVYITVYYYTHIDTHQLVHDDTCSHPIQTTGVVIHTYAHTHKDAAIQYVFIVVSHIKYCI